MDNRVVQVPFSILLHPGLIASVKVVWMALRLHPGAGPGELEASTGLSRHPILRARRQVEALNRPPAGPRVLVPTALLADRTVGAQAKTLYGLLQIIPGFRHHRGQFTYAALSDLTRMSPDTLRRAMAELAAADWVRVVQPTRLSPIKFTLGTPEWHRRLAEAAAARRRIRRIRPRGEVIMKEYLSLLIDSDQFTDNARPGFLVNPQTGERLELDRFYPSDVAFEFHGTQHDQATQRFTREESDAQHFRDLIKAGICVYQGIQLVLIRAEDLSVEGMLKRIGHRLPLRSLAGREPLIDVLEDESLTYRASVKAAEAREGRQKGPPQSTRAQGAHFLSPMYEDFLRKSETRTDLTQSNRTGFPLPYTGSVAILKRHRKAISHLELYKDRNSQP